MRKIKVLGEIAIVPLTKGYQAIIDAADVPLVDGVNWCANEAYRKNGQVRTVYAWRNGPKPERQRIHLHRVLLNAPDEMKVDHINGNGLDNRRSNLRLVDFAQNAQNSDVRHKTSSGFRGVSWSKFHGRWQAYIKAYGKLRHLGYYETIEEAAESYQRASEELHGEYSCLARPGYQIAERMRKEMDDE